MKAILAADPRGGIGYQNHLPWVRLEGDLARFRRLTTGQTVVMGRNTWDGLPVKPLPDRRNIVVSSKKLVLPQGVVQINDITKLDEPNAWCIGGARLFETLFDRINELHLTRARQTFLCDTFVDLVYLESCFVLHTKEEFSDNTYEIWERK